MFHALVQKVRFVGLVIRRDVSAYLLLSEGEGFMWQVITENGQIRL